MPSKRVWFGLIAAAVVLVIAFVIPFLLSRFTFRLAVIGGGLGGMSASLNTLRYFRDVGCKRLPIIDVYERTAVVGGRISNYWAPNADTNPVQLGGNWITAQSINVMELLAIAGLNSTIEYVETYGHGQGVFDGSKLVPPPPNAAEQSRKTDNLTDWVFQNEVRAQIASLMFRDVVWERIQDFTAPMTIANLKVQLSDTNLSEWTAATIESKLAAAGIDDQYVRDVLVPCVRFIFTQNTDINAFAGLLAVYLNTPGRSLWVRGGSLELVKRLADFIHTADTVLGMSFANIHFNHTVTEVTRHSDGTYRVDVTRGDGTKSSATYDAVIIAAPMEHAGIKLTNVPWKYPQRQWVPLDLHVVTASNTSSAYFGKSADGSAPDIITTTAGVSDWTTIIPVSRTRTGGQKVYDVFARAGKSIPVDRMFVNITNHWTKSWNYTYQVLTPPKTPADYQPFAIAHNLLYLNSFEQLFSGMEAASISGKNAGKYMAKFNAHPCWGLCL